MKGTKNRSKEVIHHSNEENPFRCPVRLLKLYNKLCPKDRPENAFYPQPLRKFKDDCWFSVKPLGHKPLNNMVREMCKAEEMEGFKTNHSLCATTAT